MLQLSLCPQSCGLSFSACSAHASYSSSCISQRQPKQLLLVMNLRGKEEGSGGGDIIRVTLSAIIHGNRVSLQVH